MNIYIIYMSVQKYCGFLALKIKKKKGFSSVPDEGYF